MTRISLILALFLIPGVVGANSTGIAGYSGKNKTTCTFCHASNLGIKAAIQGPSFLKPGDKGIYTLTMSSIAGIQKVSGVDVSATGGTLSVNPNDPGTKILNAELVHSTPKKLGGFVFTWTFDWTAPTVNGVYTLYAASLSGNGDKANTGDMTATASFPVSVGTCQSNTDCNDSNVCTTDICDMTSGQCVNTPLKGCCNTDTDCDDTDVCTTDTCKPDHTCAHVPKIGCCTSDAQCLGKDPCTMDTCDMSNNVCQHAKITDCCGLTTPCNDGNKCTTDICNFLTNTCTYTALPGCCQTNADCTDTNPCTTDTCDATTGLCSNKAKPNCCLTAADCDDQNVCTTDGCTTNKCTHKPVQGCCNTATDCDDGNPCTQDSCNKLHTCVHTPIPNCVPPDMGPPPPGDGPPVTGDGLPVTGDGPQVTGDGPHVTDGPISTSEGGGPFVDGGPPSGDGAPPAEDEGCCRVSHARDSDSSSVIFMFLLAFSLLVLWRRRR